MHKLRFIGEQKHTQESSKPESSLATKSAPAAPRGYRARPAGRQGDARGLRGALAAGRQGLRPPRGRAPPLGRQPPPAGCPAAGATVAQAAPRDREAAPPTRPAVPGAAPPAARAVLLGVFAQPLGAPRGAAVDGRGGARAPGVPAPRSRQRLRHSSYVRAAGSCPRGARRGLLVRLCAERPLQPQPRRAGRGREGPAAAGGTRGHTVTSGLNPGVNKYLGNPCLLGMSGMQRWLGDFAFLENRVE